MTTLTLFSPAEESPTMAPRGFSPASTASEFYHGYVVPSYLQLKNRNPKTEAEYDSTIRAWAEVTGDPPLRQVTQETCAEFVKGLAARDGRKGKLSPNTIIKHGIQMQMVLDLAGPRSRDRQEAYSDDGLFGWRARGVPRPAPWITKPKARKKPREDCFTLPEITAWLAACDAATEPSDQAISPANWWRALIRTLYNTDLRIGSAIAVRADWLTILETGTGMVTIPGRYYKGGDEHFIYLNEVAVNVLRDLPTRPLLFPWVMTFKSLEVHRKRLQAAAGLPEDRQFGFHALRKCGLSELAKTDLDAAGRQAGHKSLATTVRHYVSREALAHVLASQQSAAFARLPQP